MNDVIGAGPFDARLLAAAIALSLNAYAITGGADFGGGVWDLLAAGPRAAKQRTLIEKAIGPIWEANHVWLILVVVLLFTVFPPAFARLTTVLHIPLTIMLVGIVARGSAFAFRSFDARNDQVQRRWGRVFAISSVVTPVLLGVCVGAVVARGVIDVTAGGPRSFADAYVWSWLSPFTALVGLLTLVLFAFLAAVYLTVEADDAKLRDDFRQRALVSGVVLFVVAVAALIAARAAAPEMGLALTEGPWAIAIHVGTGLAAVVALHALWTRQFRRARVAAVVQVSLILWGWASAQFPYLVPPDITIQSAAAPPATRTLVLGTLAIGAAVLIPSLRYLYRVFKGRPGEGSGLRAEGPGKD